MEVEWRNVLIRKVYSLKIEEFENRPIGDFISRVNNDLKDLLNFAFQFLNNIIYVSTLLIGGFIYIFLINWIIGLIPLLIILIAISIYILFLKKLVLLRHKIKGLNTRIIWKTEETVRMITEIKNYSLNKLMYENYEKIQNRYLLAIKKSNLQLAIYKVIGVATNVLTSALILVIASYGHLEEKITDLELLGLTSATSLLVLPLINLSSIFIDIIKITPSISRLFFWINLEEEVSGNLIPKINGKIEFKNVSFSYKLNNGLIVPVLKNFNMKIEKNETINLYGLSGSGKTTIFKLLTKIYKVDSGTILIDDIPIEEINTSYLREQISLKHSNPKLFTNVFTYKELINNKKFNQILKELDIVDLFSKKIKIDDELGSQGILLSYNEKQMLAIARTLYFDSKIMLFDNIDALDENQIFKINLYLNKIKNNKTIIIATTSKKNHFNSLKQFNI